MNTAHQYPTSEEIAAALAATPGTPEQLDYVFGNLTSSKHVEALAGWFAFDYDWHAAQGAADANLETRRRLRDEAYAAVDRWHAKA